MESEASKSNINANSVTVLNAALVDCTLIDLVGESNNLGEIGAAIMSNNNCKFYDFVLYKDTIEYVYKAEITKQFKFNITSKDTAFVVDKNSNTWMLKFRSKSHLTIFASHIGLARWIASDMNSVLVQDVPGMKQSSELIDEPGVVEGDFIEIYYSAKVITDKNQLGIEVANNFDDGMPLVLKINSEWDKGLIGAKAGSRRLLLIPYQSSGIWKCLATNCLHLALFVNIQNFGKSEIEFKIRKPLTDIPLSVPSNIKTRVCRPGHGPTQSIRLIFDTMTQMKVYNSKMKEYCSHMQIKNPILMSKIEQLLKINMKTIHELEENILETFDTKYMNDFFMNHPDETDNINNIEDELAYANKEFQNISEQEQYVSPGDDKGIEMASDTLPDIDSLRN